MTDGTSSGNPFFDAWMSAHRQFIQGRPADEPAEAAEEGGWPEAMREAEANWKLYQRQAEDWMKTAARWMTPEGGSRTAEGVAEETLRRMLDPSRFLFAGTDEVNQAIQRLVEGPDLADIGTLERQVLKATNEWVALRGAGAAFRAVTNAAWSRAFATFSKETMADRELMQRGPRAVLDRWLQIANDELIRTQRTDAFLDAQRELLSAGVNYRLKERELIEVWCETHSIPTRTEVDDVHRTLHDLRGQIRALNARLKAVEARADATRPKRASPRRKAAAKQL